MLFLPLSRLGGVTSRFLSWLVMYKSYPKIEACEFEFANGVVVCRMFPIFTSFLDAPSPSVLLIRILSRSLLSDIRFKTDSLV